MGRKKQPATSNSEFTTNEFDPLAVENVGVTLAVELLEQPLSQMPPKTPFNGAGIYALYYCGDHKAYGELCTLDAKRFKYPIYIGKAAGESAKQGFNPHGSGKRKLYDRISDHAASIEEVSNLDLTDFRCRYLVLNDAYIALAESVMIRLFRPPWNGMSFGSKVVGKNRMTGTPGLWDALHPGRGGRPAGSERAGKAADLIAKRSAELQREIADPVLRRMYERVMKFV
ncbi:MAG: Eco29kI family restriction endonuclease [Pseudomonadota bacterium]|nr:Eco29kI family restriction endonuclease [Pseudomonadota bacterium]